MESQQCFGRFMSKKSQQTVHQQKTAQQEKAHPCGELERQYRKKLKEYESKLNQAKERELKALADYNNLVKRQVNQQSQLAAMAGRELIEKLISPLHHLQLAAEHLNDQGVKMVVDEFWQVLGAEGLEEINPLGQEFNEQLMEAVERDGKGLKVKKVLQRGYLYKGQVIKPAKVVVG